MKKLIFISLNECNQTLLQKVSELLPEGNRLKRLVGIDLLRLTTNDTLESELLEPWVQWVSIHTSTISTSHRVKYLGDIKKLSKLQIWERLSIHGKDSIVWGAMNARRGSGNGCKVFLPDPWEFDEEAYPKELNMLIALPRYVAKNYTSLSKIKLFKLSILFLKNYFNIIGFSYLSKAIHILFKGLIKFKFKKFIFICFYDYLSTAAFAKISKRNNTLFSYLFLNSIAHAQHHHWNGNDITGIDEIVFTFRTLEKCFELLDNEMEIFSDKNSLAVCSGLGQINTNHEEQWILYRIKNMKNFIDQLSIKYDEVETLMSYDGHILFNNHLDLDIALISLKKVTVNDCDLFFLEPDYENYKLFFRVDVSKKIVEGSLIKADKIILTFDKEVEKIVTRTGKHHADSFIYHNIDKLNKLNNKKIYNHQLFEKIFPEVFETGSQ